MLTIILTYRNRDIDIVQKCLNSLANQTNKQFKVIIVDYGSTKSFAQDLEGLVNNFSFIELIRCRTSGQLWNKSHAINIALKKVTSELIFVADIDMIFASKFVNVLLKKRMQNNAFYFQVGFLNKENSKKDLDFYDYKIQFKSKSEATGMTLFNTEDLQKINGYDEFYHGWGSEDTDVHERLKKNGVTINFCTQEILILHQWHTREYRSLNDTTPFHTKLEGINHSYFMYSSDNIIQKEHNTRGIYIERDYTLLDTPDLIINLTNLHKDIKGFLAFEMLNICNVVMQLNITIHKEYNSIKEFAKWALGKKTMYFLKMSEINNLLLEHIILHHRSKAYNYIFDQEKNTIQLTIKL